MMWSLYSIGRRTGIRRRSLFFAHDAALWLQQCLEYGCGEVAYLVQEEAP